MHKPFYAALLISLAGLLTGCPRRIDFGPRGEVRDPLELLALVDQAERSATSVDAEGQVRFDVPEGSATVGAFVSAVAPASLQIQTNDFFGRPQSVLACDGQRFGLWVAQEDAYYTGPATPANLARFIRVPLAPEEAVALLLGRAPRIAAPSWALEVDPEEGAYRLRGTDGQRSQSLWVDPLTARPVRSEVTASGGTGYRARFGDLRSDPGPFPRTISLEALGPGTSSAPAPARQARLELRTSKLALGEAIDPARFTPEAPEGVPVIEVDEAGIPRFAKPRNQD